VMLGAAGQEETEAPDPPVNCRTPLEVRWPGNWVFLIIVWGGEAA